MKFWDIVEQARQQGCVYFMLDCPYGYEICNTGDGRCKKIIRKSEKNAQQKAEGMLYEMNNGKRAKQIREAMKRHWINLGKPWMIPSNFDNVVSNFIVTL